MQQKAVDAHRPASCLGSVATRRADSPAGGWLRTAVAALVAMACAFAPPARAADASGAAPPADEEAMRFFEMKIRPLLSTHCYECHGEAEQASGLRLDTGEGVVAGGDSGPAIRPGHADQSLMIAAVRYGDPTLQMPPDGKLSDAEIADLERWVALGAPHPDLDGATGARRERAASASESLWSLEPLGRPEPPAVEDREGLANPIDAFIRARLESEGIAPNPPADKRTLIRRATYDLTGLPPTPEEIARFLADDAPDAYVRLIDRLLASPEYGQRWGRHWLDVARYADSNGLDENVAHGNAWRYRDWVVAAWNGDLPYDAFVHQQIAGDLLPGSDREERHGQLVATGFLTLGPKVLAEADKQKMEMDIIDEQLDTLGRSFLGMTIGCARCHDHKFDPIRTADYYALAGIFKSTRTMEDFKTIARWHENEIPTPEQTAARAAHGEQLDEQRRAVEALVAEANEALLSQLEDGAALPDDPESQYPEETRQKLTALREQVAELEKSAPEVDAAMGVAEGEPTDLAIHLRGSHLSLGEVVPRRFPEWVETSGAHDIPADRSGRLELARWITDPENPLTWRVMANRLWRWHFGRGLVASVDNFGRLGDEPSHPELLDWLARRLADGGSLKWLHRVILLSRTYRAGGGSQPRGRQVDPENRLLWRAPLRRLEAEALRDSLLVVSGRLDRHMGGSLLHVGNREFLFDHTSKDGTKYDSNRRSLYLPVIRNNLYDGFQLFDFGDASVINGDRATTTIATQALFLMNSELLEKSAASLAERVWREADDVDGRTRALYLRVVGREPTAAERADVAAAFERLGRLLEDAPRKAPDGSDAPGASARRATAEARAWAAVCQALLVSNEFMYVR